MNSCCNKALAERTFEVSLFEIGGALTDIYVSYIPATTRAVLIRSGVKITVQVGGRNIELPEHEMPGEVEWRRDLLQFFVTRLVCDALPCSPSVRESVFLQARQELVVEQGLHPLEFQFVLDLSRRMLARFENSMPKQGVRAFAEIDASLNQQWSALESRYRRILKGLL